MRSIIHCIVKWTWRFIWCVTQVSNQLPFTVEIFYATKDGKQKSCGFVEPRDVLNLPNTAASTSPALLFFQPRIATYVLCHCDEISIVND